MEITDEKRKEMVERIKAVISRFGADQFNPVRLRIMADKARAEADRSEAPRRIESTGGVYKFPPVDDAPPVQAPDPPVPVEKAAAAIYRTIWDKRDPILAMRKKWLAGRAARP